MSLADAKNKVAEADKTQQLFHVLKDHLTVLF